MTLLSKKEQSILLDIIYSCVHCDDVDTFNIIVNIFRDLLQVNNIVFLNSQTEFANSPRIIKELNISYPKEWADIYRSQKFVQIDPITKNLNPGLVYWKDLFTTSVPDKTFMNQAESFNLNNGFSHILINPKNFGLMSIADKQLRNTNRSKTIIKHIAPHFHQVVSRLTHKPEPRNYTPKINLREREILLWAAEGKTNWEIGEILGLTHSTVKDYIARIFVKLNTSNRTHAVAIAFQYGLIPQNAINYAASCVISI